YVQLSGRAARVAARLYDHVLGRLLLRHADGVVAVSQAAAGFVRDLAGRDAVVIHRGMAVQRMHAAAADRGVLEWARGRELVTFVGRLIDGKGVADLLEAFAATAGARRCASWETGHDAQIWRCMRSASESPSASSSSDTYRRSKRGASFAPRMWW